MKLSRYTLMKKGYPKENYYLLYNTLTRGVSVVEKKYIDMIQHDHVGTVPESVIDQMVQQGFLVKEESEDARLNMYFTGIKSSYYSYASFILTSYACNMSCSYCFENKIKDNTNTMSKKTAADVSNWLKKEYDKYKPQYAGVAFSGGEPLYNKDAIDIIITDQKQHCDSVGINFSFGLLTNGTISISEDDARFFYDNGLSFIQYTIDGNREINNARRFIEGGSYDIILQNVKRNANMMPQVESIIRVNLDEENHNQLECMLNDLKDLSIDNISLDFAIRFETPCDIRSVNSQVFPTNETPKRVAECQNLATEMGFKVSRRFTSDNPCLAVVPRQFVIDPMGDLYKCAAFAGEKDFVVGSIYQDEMNPIYIDIVGNDAWQDCKECPYVPLCGGGCLLINRNKTGDFRNKVCNRYLYENIVLDTLIRTLNREEICLKLEETENKLEHATDN